MTIKIAINGIGTGCLCAVVFDLLACIQSYAGDPFTMTSASADSWTFTYISPVLPENRLTIAGRAYVRFESALASSLPPGSPGLPVSVLILGVPSGAKLTAELKDPQYETIRNRDIAPVPSFRLDANGEAAARYECDQSVYSRDAFLPLVPLEVGKPFSFREQMLCPVRVVPVQYNPAQHVLRRIVRATIVVRMTATGALGKPSALVSPDPLAEPVYKSLVANYDQAKGWRARPLYRLAAPTADSTRSWFDPLKPYVKMGIAHDDWYRISKQDFLSLGLTPDLSTSHLYQRGHEIPAIVEGDSTISFYAVRNRGDSTFDDFYSDTSYVWMTWGTAPALRYSASAGTLIVQHVLSSAMATVHVEKNTDYYVGTGYDQIEDTYDVPGEGWVWDYYYPGTTTDHGFPLNNIDTSSPTTASISARLYSMTTHASTPDHIAAFTLNGASIGQVSFNGREGAWPVFTVPLTQLSASNVLRVQSVPTATPVNEFYLDWFEIAYRRNLVAVGDSLLFTVTSAEASPASRFRAKGFSTADILALDITDGRQMTPDSIVSELDGTFSVVFSDTLSVNRTYLVTARLPHRLPVTMASRQFTDLRSLPGADYIVISHPLFLHAASELAAQRKASRGIRTQVVSVEDIYDEFNFGIISPYAIKRFLSYAYQNWSVPAPSNVVLLGDASWDPHRYMSTTVMTDFVPAFGVPSSDNWYACFDTASPWLPSMFIGRLTAMDSLQAESVVSKIVEYDGTAKGAWDKRMLFMTAGGDSTENMAFAQSSDNVIATYTAPAPLGAENIRAYKMSPSIIDGSMKPSLMNTFNRGLSFVSFLGHSGGRIWGLDAGSPYDLQIVNGQLPFIASVSCNVGGFATPTGMVLAEDYLLADHRGAIGVWASASLGYPTYGTILVEDFLAEMVQGVRSLGAATTASRIQLIAQWGSNYITIAHQYLTPLLGDPLSDFAVPLKPDLALQSSDILTDPTEPTSADSVVTINVRVQNYGTVPSVPAILSVNDTYQGRTTSIASSLQVPRVYYVDSASAVWRPSSEAGQHTFTFAVALPDSIQEVSKSNNSLSLNLYLYANTLHAVRPFDGQVVGPGPTKLVVASRTGDQGGGVTYTFELDTLETFDSPFHMVSTNVTASPASGAWSTPSLPAGTTFYWRARTVSSASNSPWTESNFSTSTQLPLPPLVRWQQRRQSEFGTDSFTNAASTDSGVTIQASPATMIRCRSLGGLANADKDYYSVIQVGLDVITGLWWEVGNSYMAVRVNNNDGTYVFRPFDLSNPALADSMAAFISGTPSGMYLGMVAMANGQSNVNEALYTAIEGLGSQKIRLVQNGQAWALIARKGFPAETIEDYRTDSTTISRQLPTYYGAGLGAVATQGLPVPVRWDSFRWQTVTAPGVTEIRGWMTGIRKDGGVDTVKVFSADSNTVSLGSINNALGDYSGFKFGASLSTHESSITPRLVSWSADFVPPADLALAKLVPGGDLVVPRGTPVNIPLGLYNLGYRRSDSTLLSVGMYDLTNKLIPLFSVPGGGLAVDSGRSMTVTVPTENLSRHVTLELSVSPADSSGDLFAGDNSVAYAFMVTGAPLGSIDVFADGVGLMDGDFVAQRPKLLVRPRLPQSGTTGPTEGSLLVDGTIVEPPRLLVDGEATFSPNLDPGHHEINVRLTSRSTNGLTDTLQRTLSVAVSNQLQILRAYNFPNPFSSRTEFTFVLAGSGSPDAARIRVYTVAGRKIRDMALDGGQVVVGFNRIPWDGRDEDGDLLANGVYFYQIEVSAGGKTVNVLGKLAKVR